MKKALLLAPAPSVLELFNQINMDILSGLSYQVHLASNFEPANDSTHMRAFRDAMAKRHIACHHIPFYRGSLIKNLSAIGRCRALLEQERFDLIHAQTETGGLITRLAMLGGVTARTVYTPHGMSFYKGCPLKNRLLYYPVEKWICAGMDAVIAINWEEYALLRRWDRKTARFTHGIGIHQAPPREDRVGTVPARSDLGIPEDAFLIVSVGELDRNKNHEAVLRAVEKLNNQNIWYLICGAGPLESRLSALSRALGISDTVILAGYRHDIGGLLRLADVFAHPSRHEGLPVSLMEAMAAGLPVICSNIRGNTDLVADGQNGFLCEPDDPDGFAAALGRLMNDRDLGKRMGRAGQLRIRQYSAETVGRELKDIYQEAEVL